MWPLLITIVSGVGFNRLDTFNRHCYLCLYHLKCNTLFSESFPQLAAQGHALSCAVCKAPYKLEVESRFKWSSCSDVSATHWLKLCLMVVAIIGILMCALAACHILPTPAYKMLVIGVSVVAIYVILK